MKKALALVLTLAMILSLGVCAFAAGSVIQTDDTSKKDATSPLPVIDAPAGEEKNSFELDVCDEATDETNGSVAAKVVALGNADELPAEKAEAFEAAYEEAAAITDGVVKYFFWVDLAEEVSEGEYVALTFECEGDNVVVYCNGVQVEVVKLADGKYMAKLPSGGAVAVVVA